MPSGGPPPREGFSWQLLSRKWHSGMEKSLSLWPSAWVPFLALPPAPVWPGSGLLSGSRFPSCERRLAQGRAEDGFQEAERGEQSSLNSSLPQRGELSSARAAVLWPVDVGSRGERAAGQRKQGLRSHAEPGRLAEMALRPSLASLSPVPHPTPEVACGSPHLSQFCPAKPPNLGGVVPLPSRRPQSEGASNLRR